MTTLAKVLISVLLALVLSVPNNSFYSIIDINETGFLWLMDYVFMFSDYLPMLLLWITYLLIRTQKVKHLVYILLIVYAVILFFGVIIVHLIPIQDYAPAYGVYLGALFFPILFIDNLYGKRKAKIISRYPE